ncbi:hypothetical protein PanWU01x14_366610 [Parasponia andersonii]|uniref:Uncharacterized protein n=1 Tax=Parasponia andersonii TaxID=3476 RepID=A0A2P5A5L8_PARAD|nr:hypothetical protein PanWU01x14_366610 [Parasponia andersonii]
MATLMASPMMSQSSTSTFPEGDDEVLEIQKLKYHCQHHHHYHPSSNSSSAVPILPVDSDQYCKFFKN